MITKAWARTNGVRAADLPCHTPRASRATNTPNSPRSPARTGTAISVAPDTPDVVPTSAKTTIDTA